MSFNKHAYPLFSKSLTKCKKITFIVVFNKITDFTSNSLDKDLLSNKDSKQTQTGALKAASSNVIYIKIDKQFLRASASASWRAVTTQLVWTTHMAGLPGNITAKPS
jgi:hypothetical protein